jgi:hypothetical protein
MHKISVVSGLCMFAAVLPCLVQGQDIGFSTVEMKAQAAVQDWEKNRGIYTLPAQRAEMVAEVKSAAVEFKKRNADVSMDVMASATGPVVNAYLDKVATSADTASLYGEFAATILKANGLAFPSPNKRGTLRIVISGAAPDVVQIDTTTMIPPGVTYLLKRGAYEVMVKARFTTCKEHLTIEAGRETLMLCPKF